MTINVTGPKKYDFQDLVCLAVGLRSVQRSGAELLIEPDGGEDCELRENGSVVEIQVKGAEGRFSIKDLADYLGHSGTRVAGNTLLERLLADNCRFVVLVLSSRCDDVTSTLVEPFGWKETERDHSFGKKNAEALLAAFAKPTGEKNPSKLTRARDQHRATIAAGLTPDLLNIALRRLALIERLDEGGLTSVCEDLLVRIHDVPGDRTGDTINRLRDVIKAAKGLTVNVLPDFAKILDNSSAGSLCPKDYIERGNEADWQDELSQQRVLLLTGRPRTGKSDAARYVAAKYQKLGYSVRILSDVKEAERFLSEPSGSHRLAILDDPLGGTHTEPEHVKIYQQLEDLIGHLRHDRRLIVSQSQEQLLVTTGAIDVSKLDIDGHPWHDLSAFSAAFSAKIWGQETASVAMPPELAQFVNDALASGKLVLDAGSIRHLARHHAKISVPYKVGQMERIAHERASALADVWKGEGLQPLARSLAIGTTAMEPISETELAFLLGEGGEGLPGMPISDFAVTQIGGDPPKPSPDADYDEEPKLDQTALAGLDAFETRRLINYCSSHRVNFAHAYYRAAGEVSAGVSTKKQVEDALMVLTRALFCRSGATSRAAARNLDWIHDRLRRSGRPKAIPELAERGLKSYFPATRDLCYAFLMRYISELPRDFQARLPDWVTAIRRRDVATMAWREDEACLPLGQTFSGAERLEALLFPPEREDVWMELNFLEAPEESYLRPQGACRALSFYEGQPSALGHQAMSRLLNYGEGFIRATAAEIWLSADRSGDDDILRQLNADDHPAVASAMLDGAVKGWPNLSQTRKARLTGIISSQASAPAAAAAMMPNLVRFDRIEYTGPTRAWDLFAAVMPSALDALPATTDFTEARLFNVVMEARGKITPEFLTSICDSWLHWLERLIGEGLIPDDFSLGFVDLLLDITNGKPELREGRLARALSLPGSSAPYVIISDIAEHWETLSDTERQLLEDLLVASRSDALWLKASVLTSSIVPKDLEHLLLPASLTLDAPPETLLSDIPTELLTACIQAFTGQPSRLWNRAHRNAAVWQPVVDVIVRRPDHPLFELAWNAISGTGKASIVRQIIEDCGPQHAELFLGLLIKHKVGRVGDFMPQAWSAVLDQAPDRDTRTEWLSRALIYMTAILEDLGDLELWLLDEDDKIIALHILQPDINAIMTAREISQGEDRLSVTLELLEQFNKQLPHLHGTYGRIQRILKDPNGENVEFNEILEKLRLKNLALGSKLKKHLLGEEEWAEPVGWMHP